MDHVLTTFEIEEARTYWNAFKECVRARCNQHNLRFREVSADKIGVTTQDSRTLYVTFAPADSRRQLSYELENGCNEELEFVFDKKPYLRLNGVSYSAEALGQKLFQILVEPR